MYFGFFYGQKAWRLHNLVYILTTKKQAFIIFFGSFENEALENEDRSTKHPKLENEAPYLENEAPKKLDTGLSFINTRPM